MIKIIIGIILVVVLLFAFYSIFNNKFQLAIIKIEKGEEDIDIYLEKKHDLLVRVKALISKEIKKEEILADLNDSYDELNHFDKHDLLKKLYNELFKIIDDHEKLLKSESITSILEELNTNEENIVGAIKFYNDTVVEFNQLIVAFPSNIISLIKRYKKKEFYRNEKREIFEVLNTK